MNSELTPLSCSYTQQCSCLFMQACRVWPLYSTFRNSAL